MIRVDKELCIGCGACVSVCPTNSLVLNEDGKCEINNESCIQCLACITTCPVEAISEGEEKILASGLLGEESSKKLIHCFADWCGPCKMLEPVLKEIENDIEIIHINVDENQEMATKYNVMSIPTLILLEDGKEIDRNVGVCDLAFLKDFISKET